MLTKNQENIFFGKTSPCGWEFNLELHCEPLCLQIELIKALILLSSCENRDSSSLERRLKYER